MVLKKIGFIAMLAIACNVNAASEWTFIGKTANDTSVFATSADTMSDGSLRMFLKAEKEMERKPEGMLAIFKKPEKYTDASEPFAILVNCKKRVGRNFVAGPLGSEFHVPWEPITPGSYGAVAFAAFCKK